MPLIKSKSKAAIGKNIAAEENAGKPKRQAIAIALNTARKAGAKIPKKKVKRVKMDKKIHKIQKTTKKLEKQESSLLKADKKQDKKMAKCKMMKKGK